MLNVGPPEIVIQIKMEYALEKMMTFTIIQTNAKYEQFESLHAIKIRCQSDPTISIKDVIKEHFLFAARSSNEISSVAAGASSAAAGESSSGSCLN